MNVDLKSPSLNLSGDSNVTLNYKKDDRNFITQVFAAQLPAIQTGFFNAHLSKDVIVQPHWHTNATELVFVISGEVITSVFDPFTQKLLSYRLKPGQVSQFPKGWFHWIVALTDYTHILTIFDVPTPDIVYGSDFLRFIPKEILNLAYCVNEEEYAKAVAPIQESVILGPPPGCIRVPDEVGSSYPQPVPITSVMSGYPNYSGYPSYGAQSGMPNSYINYGYGQNNTSY
ncbi:oxalate decarboxylase/phosphoglucose isomerase-like protein (cupin superfamily) [Paenibacillus shirakamiensis]|uniref:Oxalate decarboxylase/phosphoglucose isomerase-like protein (Cupin superfamily) n=1 Tax=Paenibacillus shirakamiensis TaxID=1265935 RepID=A0ABS4JJY8_9BACL|nr:oxalate decarboxylase/phosphoglucose isomerase-like protein (cupin superfamily) [Paenibacillus shirakamiensis]